MNFKQKIASGAIAVALLGGTGASIAAQNTNNGQQGGAAGLVAAVVQATDTIDINDSTIEVVSVDINDSLNNLTALNNILNNSPILNDLNIEVVDVIDVGDIDVNVSDFLNENNIAVDDVIGVAVLSGGDFIVLT